MSHGDHSGRKRATTKPIDFIAHKAARVRGLDHVVRHYGPGSGESRAVEVLARIMVETGADRGELWFELLAGAGTLCAALGERNVEPMTKYGLGIQGWFIKLGPSVRQPPREFDLGRMVPFLIFHATIPTPALSLTGSPERRRR